MDREARDSDVLAALRSEVEGWAPRRVPNLIDLAGRAEHHWLRPVVLASRLGATALAVVLVLAAAVVLTHPPFPGSEQLVERLSLVRP